MKLTDTQEVDLAVAYADRKGKPATIENVVWESSDVEVATVAPDPADPLKAVVTAVSTGQCTITANGDANLVPGPDNVRNVTATFSIEVGAGEAVVAGITAGTPREQAPH